MGKDFFFKNADISAISAYSLRETFTELLKKVKKTPANLGTLPPLWEDLITLWQKGRIPTYSKIHETFSILSHSFQEMGIEAAQIPFFEKESPFATYLCEHSNFPLMPYFLNHLVLYYSHVALFKTPEGTVDIERIKKALSHFPGPDWPSSSSSFAAMVEALDQHLVTVATLPKEAKHLKWLIAFLAEEAAALSPLYLSPQQQLHLPFALKRLLNIATRQTLYQEDNLHNEALYALPMSLFSDIRQRFSKGFRAFLAEDITSTFRELTQFNKKLLSPDAKLLSNHTRLTEAFKEAYGFDYHEVLDQHDGQININLTMARLYRHLDSLALYNLSPSVSSEQLFREETPSCIADQLKSQQLDELEEGITALGDLSEAFIGRSPMQLFKVLLLLSKNNTVSDGLRQLGLLLRSPLLSPLQKDKLTYVIERASFYLSDKKNAALFKQAAAYVEGQEVSLSSIELILTGALLKEIAAALAQEKTAFIALSYEHQEIDHLARLAQQIVFRPDAEALFKLLPLDPITSGPLLGEIALLAARHGKVALLDSVLTLSPNLRLYRSASLHSQHKTPLHLAAVNAQNEAIILLLKKASPEIRMTMLEAKDLEGHTALHLASCQQHLKTMALLIEQGACIHSIDNETKTALHHAASKGHTKIVDFLLQKGAAVSKIDQYGHTPLYDAFIANHQDCFASQVSRATVAELETQEATSGRTLLHMAVMHHREAMLRLLLLKGVSGTIADKNGQTALHYAAALGNITCLKTLLASLPAFSPLLEQKDSHHCTALFLATKREQHKVLTLLLDKGAKLDVADDFGLTPLHFATYKGKTKVAKILINHGADVNSVTSDGYTPMHYVARIGHVELIKALLVKGANVHATTAKGINALQIAAMNGHIDAIITLLHHGAKLEALTGYTAELKQSPDHGAHKIADTLLQFQKLAETIMEAALKEKGKKLFLGTNTLKLSHRAEKKKLPGALEALQKYLILTCHLDLSNFSSTLMKSCIAQFSESICASKSGKEGKLTIQRERFINKIEDPSYRLARL